MTAPNPDDLLELAALYALHALSDEDAAALERRVEASDPATAEAFRAEVQSIYETMAVVSASTAVEPPAELRERLLEAVAADPVRTLPTPESRRRRSWRTIALAAAAAVVIGVGGVTVWTVLQPPDTLTEQVLASPDVQTVKGEIPTGGFATLQYSRARNAGVLTMTDVAPPSAGTVYQMWLVHKDGSVNSAGTMGPSSVLPVTTADLPDLADSTALAFTVEPGDGSPQPTGDVFAQLPII